MSRIPLNALRVFEATARLRSFTAASDALFVSPAAVSQQIAKLEKYLRVKLFKRDGRRVELTAEGSELLQGVRRGLDELELALSSLKQNRRGGPLAVALLASFLQRWMLPRMRSWRRRHPGIALRLHTSNDLVDFARESMHVGIRFGGGKYPGLHVEKLLDEWLVPVASPETLRKSGFIERRANLSRFPLLDTHDTPWTLWTLQGNEHANIDVLPSMDDSVGVLAAAEEGLGYALARWSLASHSIQRGLLKIAAKQALRYESAYYFVAPPAYLEMPKVAAFRQWLIEEAQEFDAPDVEIG